MEVESFDAISFFLYTCILYFLSILSKRLGEVMGMKKYYYFYYAGMIFTLSASAIMALSVGDKDSELFWNGYVLFAAGLTLSLIASIKYWGWIIKELVKG